MNERTETHDVEAPRLVVLGDPHGDLAGLEAVVAKEGREGVAYLSVGDNVGYADGPTSSRLCARLRELGAISVFGNHEVCVSDEGRLLLVSGDADWQLDPEALAWSRSLPRRVRLRLKLAPDLDVVLQHTLGTRWDYVHHGNAHYAAAEAGGDVVFLGHAHAPRIFEIQASRTPPPAHLQLEGPETVEHVVTPGLPCVVDAGSLARPGYHPQPGNFALATYATFDVVERRLALHAVAKADA